MARVDRVYTIGGIESVHMETHVSSASNIVRYIDVEITDQDEENKDTQHLIPVWKAKIKWQNLYH